MEEKYTIIKIGKASRRIGEIVNGYRVLNRVVPEGLENSKLTYYLCDCIGDCKKQYIISSKQFREGKKCECHKFVRFENGNRTRLYRIYTSMINRCNNKSSNDYSNYGEKEIFVSKDFDSFDGFYEWSISNGYKDNLSIDRIDVSKEYSIDNCRWATSKEQSLNKTNTLYVYLNSEKHTLYELCEKYRIDYSKAWQRYNRGWSIEEILEIVPRKKTGKTYSYMDNEFTIVELSKILNISRDIIRYRLQKNNKTIDDFFNEFPDLIPIINNYINGVQRLDGDILCEGVDKV